MSSFYRSKIHPFGSAELKSSFSLPHYEFHIIRIPTGLAVPPLLLLTSKSSPGLSRLLPLMETPQIIHGWIKLAFGQQQISW